MSNIIQKPFTWSTEYHNALVNAFTERIDHNGIAKGSEEWFSAQQEFFLGAAKAISLITCDSTLGYSEYFLLVNFPKMEMKKHSVKKVSKS